MIYLVHNAYYKLVAKKNTTPVNSFWCFYHYTYATYRYIGNQHDQKERIEWFECQECGKTIAPHTTIFDLIPVASIRLPQTKH